MFVFKVFQPCVLITKKRYVGYMYETVDQKEPVFDAKGIETVRRDNCPAVGKVSLFNLCGNMFTVMALVTSAVMDIILFGKSKH